MAKLSAILLAVLVPQLITHVKAWPEVTKLYKVLPCGNRTSEKYSFVLTINTNLRRKCVYRIDSYSPNVRQLFIAFRFNLEQPTRSANSTTIDTFVPECKTDYLQIAGRRFCGSEKFQHVYVPFSPSAGVTSIKIHSALSPYRSDSGRVRRLFLEMAVEQLEVNSTLCFNKTNGCPKNDKRLAPADCLQYFTKEEDIITSFNYRDGHGIYPAGLSYNICVQHPPGAWALRLEFLDFNLPGRNATCNETLQDRENHLCLCSDYLYIPNSIVEPIKADDFLNVNHNRFCGSVIKNKTIISEDSNSLDQFFRMHFESKAIERRTSRAGFRIKYKILYEKDASILYGN